jgi:cobalt-precorrin 5A hydrolase
VSVPHPSAVVGKHMGVESVCEAAAIAASAGGRLLVPKTKSALATAALAI